MRLRFGHGLIGLAAVFALAGCTVNGPDPEPPSSAPTSEAESSSSLDLPQRPKELAIAGKQDAEICTWLSPEQKAPLQVGGGRPVVKNGNNYNGCSFAGAAGKVNFGISLRVVPEGLDAFAPKIAAVKAKTAKTYEVNGFGAVQAQVPGGESLGCAVFVDAAEGQTLYVDLSLTTPGGMNNDQMCERAKQAAEAAVTTLQGS
ncbi:DUF3558 domain-containing protein [Saccharopolyspora sp. NPDC050642]|uniref:DUF3558 domain-containing protein n=1 Tax=Saccharopolyspora sp. NPDC050642 TaxID=3157099 RepID=UPI0033FC6CBD